jgi:hypothetical protein
MIGVRPAEPLKPSSAIRCVCTRLIRVPLPVPANVSPLIVVGRDGPTGRYEELDVTAVVGGIVAPNAWPIPPRSRHLLIGAFREDDAAPVPRAQDVTWAGGTRFASSTVPGRKTTARLCLTTSPARLTARGALGHDRAIVEGSLKTSMPAGT